MVSLAGRVSAAGGGPIAGAEVMFVDGPHLGRSTLTDGTGEYRFENVTRGNANLSARAQGYAEVRAPVFVDGTNRLDFTLERSGPLTEFGPGTWLVGSQIAPGRYFAEPDRECYWERRTADGRLAANERISGDAPQIIVDIASTDRTFETNARCGVWVSSPRAGAQTSIPPGSWLVNTQITPGTYRALGTGCYWERVRGFSGDTGDIIAADAPAGSGPHTVTIASSDVGFKSTGECGTWTPN